MNRSDYNDKINHLLKPFGLTYEGEHTKIVTEEIFEVLDGIDKKTNQQRKQLAILKGKENLHPLRP